MKPTPGPWKMHEREQSHNTIPVGDEFNIVAYVTPKPHYNDTQTTNARLIAAAPELLEALQCLTTAANAKDVDAVIMFAAIEKARTAITKATEVQS
jgi:hypothetical protein